MRSFSAVTLVAMLAFAASCSSKEDVSPATAGVAANTTPVAVSGSRLRAKLVVAGDARELVGFYDTQRKEDCTFQRMDDQRWRCVPASIPYLPNGVGFSDAACQTAIGALSATGCALDAKYALDYDYATGCNPPPVRSIRKILDPKSPVYIRTGASTCALQPAGATTQAGIAVGDVVPWTEFVEATQTSTADAGLAENALLASDGAQQHLGFTIRELETDCTFQIMSDGVARCVPKGTIGPVFYSDPSCRKAAFVNDYESQSSCAATSRFRLVQDPATPSCTGIRNVYSLSDFSGDADNAYVETSSGSSSGSGTEEASCTYQSSNYYNGARRGIDADLTASLPTRQRIGSGSGRLVPALVVKAGTSELTAGWHDNERNVDCTFALATDGKLRCLPAGQTAAVFFTDTACKSPSRVAVLQQASCTGAPAFTRVESTTCPPTTKVYALAPQMHNVGAASLESAPGRCLQVQGVTNAFDATESDPTQFVEGAAVTE